MSIKWSGDLPLNLVKLDPYIQKRMVIAAHAFAPRVEKHMKENAPWTDRTGNARNGLTARPDVRDGGAEVAIVLAHAVPYGIWLEVRFSGAYAIILPTIEEMAPQFMKLVARLIFVDASIGGSGGSA